MGRKTRLRSGFLVSEVIRDELGRMTGTAGRRRIVAGVHGSAGSLAALRWAVREAALRDARLLVVRAWEDPARTAAPYASPFRRHGDHVDRAAAATALREAVQAAMGGRPPATVDFEVVEGLPARVLLDRSAGADLLVIGAAGDPVYSSIGAVAQACLIHAPCPVAVVAAQAAVTCPDVREPASSRLSSAAVSEQAQSVRRLRAHSPRIRSGTCGCS